MIFKPYSYNGTSLQSTDYVADFPRASALLQMETNANYIRRAGAVPVLSGKNFEPTALTLEVKCGQGDWMSVFESLNQLFDTKDETPRQLVVQDTSDTSAENPKRYYAYATAERVLGGHDGEMATIKLALDDPIWQSVTLNSQTWSVTDSTGTTDVTIGGNDYAYPIFDITPSTQPSSDYLYNMYVQVLPTSSLPWADRFLDITGSSDTTFDTAALVAGGKMQADGDDLRVFRDGVEVDRWLNGINTTDTHVIVVADMPHARNMTLGTAIASTDTVTEIELSYTNDNAGKIRTMPNEGRLIIDTSIGSTDTEEFTYTDMTVTDTKLAFTIDSRSVRNTSAFAHSVGDNVRYLPYDFNIVYGNPSATAPAVDDTLKPIQALTSRNNSFVYNNFWNEAGLRANIWTPYLRNVSNSSLSRSDFFTSTDDAGDTDPATGMGMAAYTYEGGGVWRSDSIQLAWLGYFPDLVASVSANGEQNQTSASFPVPRLQAGRTLSAWTNLWAVSAQTATDYSTWTTWSKASSDATIPDNTRYLRWRMAGTITGSTDHSSKADITSITVGLTNYPNIALRPETGSYKVDLTISNDTTGDKMRVVYSLLNGEVLRVDTDPDFPTAKHKGKIVNGTIRLSTTRAEWLKLQPGTNTLGYQTHNDGANDVEIVIRWRDRANFL